VTTSAKWIGFAFHPRRELEECGAVFRRVLPLILLTLAVISFGTTARAAAGSPVRILSPRIDSFHTATSVTVRVRAARSAGKPRATLNRKRIDSSFMRSGRSEWIAHLPPGRLKMGTDRLVVSVGVGGGRRRYASTRFTVGKRDRSLLTVAPSRAAGVAARIRATSRPRMLTAKLNGKRLRWPLGLLPARKETLRLGGDDGLHFGVNHLKVLAVGKRDRYDVERRRIVVRRDRPLAGAGADRKVVAGQKTRLDGRSSRAAHPGKRLSYHWEILSRPSGSHARLVEADSPRPSLKTDEPGKYQVRLQVTEGGAPAATTGPQGTDILTLFAVEAVPPIGLPVETMASNEMKLGGADSGIRIGEETFWLGAPQGATAQAVVIDRETLKVIYHASFKTEAEAAALNDELAKIGSKPIVIISVPNLQGTTPRNGLLAADAIQMGIELPTPQLLRSGWSAIGAWGTKEGGTLGAGANQNIGKNGANYAGDISGYLQRTRKAGFVFVPGSRVAFETDAPGAAPNANKMVVGGATYTSPTLPSCATGGFQVQELMAETLIPGETGTFITAGCGATSEETEQRVMAEFLEGLAQEQGSGAGAGPHLVLVQSIGSPYGAGGNGEWDKIGAQIEALGGVAPVFDAARSSYALVGGVGITPLPRAEASQTLTGVKAQLSGVLKPNLSSAYSPELFSPSGMTTFPLSSILYEAPEAWPDSQSGGDKAALAYIAEHVLHLEAPTLDNACEVPLGPPDVRSEYCNEGYATLWGHFATKLEKAPFVPGHGFEKQEWEAVVEELAKHEFETVQRVWAMVDNMQKVFGTSSGTGEVDLDHLATEIEEALTPPPTTETLGWWLELVGNLASTGSYFSFSEDEKFNGYIQKALGVLQGIMFESSSSLSESDGEPVLNRFKTEVQDFAIELSNRYVEDSKGAAKVGDILVSDYGKLQAIEASGMLGYNAETYASAIEAVEWGVKSWTYENLMPTAYEAVKLEGGTLEGPLKNASEYECSEGEGRYQRNYYPFKQIKGAEYKIESPSEYFGVLVKVGSQLPEREGNYEEYPPQPTAKILEPLIEPAHGTLAYFAPWWWHDVYHFPSSKTRHTYC
jgi:hypothetical protein